MSSEEQIPAFYCLGVPPSWTSVWVSLGWHNKYHRFVGLNNRHLYFSQFWGLGSTKSGCQHDQVLMWALFLAWRWQPSHCILTWYRESSGFSSFIRAPALSDQCSTLIISFNLNHLLEVLSTMQSYNGLRLQYQHGKEGPNSVHSNSSLFSYLGWN